MAVVVTGVRWEDHLPGFAEGGYDIHVLANGVDSRRLDRELFVTYTENGTAKGDWIDQLGGIGLKATFTPEFARTPAGADTVKHTPTKVTVNTKTGVVNLPVGAVPLPPDAGSTNVLRNFLIRTSVTDASNTEFAVKPAVRVHLHDFMVFGWFTPSPLTVHRDFVPPASELPRPKFSLLGQFNDFTIGDITRHAGLKWHSSDSSTVHVDEDNGGLKALSSSSGATITVTLPASLGGPDTAMGDGTVRCAPDWDTQVKAELIKGSPGLASAATALNIIFLSEGFLASEKDQFRDTVLSMVHFLRTSSRTRPYDLLQKSINFWMAFVPSRQPGPSTVYEMKPVKRGAKTVWGEVDLPEPPLPSGLYSAGARVHELGLPIPADLQVNAVGSQIPIWTARYGPKATGRVNQARHTAWLGLANRTLANERDTAFGIRLGDRPRVHEPEAARAPTLSPFRCRREHLDRFFKALVGPGNAPIGHLWNAPTSKDRPLVVFICAGARHCGARDPNKLVLALGLRSESEVDASLDPAGALNLIPFPIPGSPGVDSHTTLAHECAHALGFGVVHPFGVGDEYGTKRPLVIPHEAEAGVDPYGNLQTETSLKGGGPAVLGRNIKWGKWHRIAKAAVLKAKPTPEFAGFRIPLVKQPPVKFAGEELVRLRKRPLATAPPASVEFKIVTVSGNDLIVSNLPGQSGNATTFSAGDVVFVPRRRKVPPPQVQGPELMLVAKVISDHVDALHAPLNAVSFLGPLPPTPHVCSATGGALLRANNLPASGLHPTRPKFTSWIVGIYDGGDEYECGVYHPAGVCTMRRRLIPPDKQPKGVSPIYAFCHVCRYILVDNLDPTLHGTIDDDYQGQWPEPD